MTLLSNCLQNDVHSCSGSSRGGADPARAMATTPVVLLLLASAWRSSVSWKSCESKPRFFITSPPRDVNSQRDATPSFTNTCHTPTATHGNHTTPQQTHTRQTRQHHDAPHGQHTHMATHGWVRVCATKGHVLCL